MLTLQQFKALFIRHMSQADFNRLIADRQTDLVEFFRSTSLEDYSLFLGGALELLPYSNESGALVDTEGKQFRVAMLLAILPALDADRIKAVFKYFWGLGYKHLGYLYQLASSSNFVEYLSISIPRLVLSLQRSSPDNPQDPAVAAKRHFILNHVQTFTRVTTLSAEDLRWILCGYSPGYLRDTIKSKVAAIVQATSCPSEVPYAGCDTFEATKDFSEGKFANSIKLYETHQTILNNKVAEHNNEQPSNMPNPEDMATDKSVLQIPITKQRLKEDETKGNVFYEIYQAMRATRSWFRRATEWLVGSRDKWSERLKKQYNAARGEDMSLFSGEVYRKVVSEYAGQHSASTTAIARSLTEKYANDVEVTGRQIINKAAVAAFKSAGAFETVTVYSKGQVSKKLGTFICSGGLETFFKKNPNVILKGDIVDKITNGLSSSSGVIKTATV